MSVGSVGFCFRFASTYTYTIDQQLAKYIYIYTAAWGPRKSYPTRLRKGWNKCGRKTIVNEKGLKGKAGGVLDRIGPAMSNKRELLFFAERD